MQLDKLQLKLRERSSWEAVDLGFAVNQRFFKSIYIPWSILVSSLFFICLVCSLTFSAWLGTIAFWYLLPLCERSVLFVVSRSIFGEAPDRKTVMKNWTKECRKGFWTNMLFWRWLPSRSFALPIWQLENLKGKNFAKRHQILQRKVGNTATWLGVIFFQLQVLLTMSAAFLVLMFLPQGFIQNQLNDLQINTYFDIFLIIEEFIEHDNVKIFVLILYYFVVLAVRPFYISSGFILYLNRRIDLEAWDIEVQFRALADRLIKKSSGILKSSLIILSLILPFSAQMDDKSAAKQEIESVMNEEEFNTKKEIKTYFDFGEDEEEDKEEESDTEYDGSGIEALGHLIKFLSIAAIIAILIYFIKLFVDNKANVAPSVPTGMPVAKPKAIMGMDLQDTELDKDIVQKAKSLWNDGENRQALALLYRSSLYRFLHDFHLPLKESFTEYDCLKSVNENCSKETHTYFKSLTDSWVMMAYAEQAPEDQHFNSLCDQWQRATSKTEVKND